MRQRDREKKYKLYAEIYAVRGEKRERGIKRERGRKREKESERKRQRKARNMREIRSKRGKEREREAVRGEEREKNILWKLSYSVRDPNYGILLEYCGNENL